ncbi:MAG: ABC transporter ATP-binding protein [Vallitaleaceae bacterium]|nr:ABC transporter ATP-binding protein [Vallitaleaceae bacterium]
MEVVMDLKGVTKVYLMGKEKIRALDGIDLQIERGEICCLLGPSGSGKSTLLNMMAGLEKPTKGTITFQKYHIEKMNENTLASFRRRYIGFVFQSYNLIPTLNALENITMPLLFKGVTKAQRKKIGNKMLKDIGLLDRAKHKPSEMSGGQQQRVSIARAFINNPEVIFADEPTGNLDTHTAENMMSLMINLCKKNNQTLIIVTHNTELAGYADKIVHIRDGMIERIEKIEKLVEIKGDVKGEVKGDMREDMMENMNEDLEEDMKEDIIEDIREEKDNNNMENEEVNRR